MLAVVALAAGILAAFCFPPYSLGLFVVVPLAVLQWAWRDAGPARAAWYGFLFGAGCYGLVVGWLRYFGMLAFAGSILIMASSLAIAGLIVGLLGRRGVRSPLLTAAVWVIAEAFLGRVPFGGFPWASVAVALHDLPAARALARFGGVALTSFVAVAIAGFLLDAVIAAVIAWRARRTPAGEVAGEVDGEQRRLRWQGGAQGGWHGLVVPLVGVVTLVGVAVLADAIQYQPTSTGQLHVAILQGDDQQLSLAGQRSQQLTDDHLALADQLHGDYDLIIFPEGALDTDPELDAALRDELTAIAAEHHAALLVNARVSADRDTDTDKVYNANLLYDPDGKLQGEYAKQHLVPFGEYVPLRGVFGDFKALRDNVPYDYTPGDETKVFDVKGTPVGSVICFESAFGELVRDSVRKGAQAVVVSTNNRSYRRSGNTDQHLALAQLRAAETARPVVQASVSGISAIVDADGTVHDRTELFQKAIVDASITTTTGETPYVRFGDWVVAACALAVVVATVIAVRRRPA